MSSPSVQEDSLQELTVRASALYCNSPQRGLCLCMGLTGRVICQAYSPRKGVSEPDWTPTEVRCPSISSVESPGPPPGHLTWFPGLRRCSPLAAGGRGTFPRSLHHKQLRDARVRELTPQQRRRAWRGPSNPRLFPSLLSILQVSTQMSPSPGKCAVS